MKILIESQKNLTTLGISSKQLIQNHSYNKRILIGLLVLIMCFVSHCVFISDMASTFMEYVECMYMIAADTMIFVGFGSMVVEIRNLIEYIETTEKIIDESE